MPTENLFEDFYGALGITPDAKEEEVRQAYRQLARRYHPDNQATGDEAKFRAVAEAFEVLGDAEKRKRYDRERKRKGLFRGARFSEGDGGIGDIFGIVEDFVGMAQTLRDDLSEDVERFKEASKGGDEKGARGAIHDLIDSIFDLGESREGRDPERKG